MISQSTIQEILDTARIEEVVGEFVTLKKRGSNYVGLCPFHNEKTPSFFVSPDKEIYKCFGCGHAGNVVRFLMEHEKFTYPEALKYLARKYRIEIKEEFTDDEEDRSERDEISSIYVVLSFAEEFYHHYLLHSEEGQNIALPYLKSRHITEESIQKFKLGYSPESGNLFTQTALKKQFKEEYLIASGLTIKHHDGSLKDRFRGRIMFPIHSIASRTVGFGGRTMKSDPKEAKYINSPETKVYSKSQILYGLDLAKNSIRKNDELYLVEGYTDVIAMHQAGVENVCASLGTSLTENHVRLIKRYTPNLTLIYDGDEAGIKAALRGIDLALKNLLQVKAIALPEGHDPDTFTRIYSHNRLKIYLKDNAQDFIFFKTSVLLPDKEKLDPVKKARTIKEVVSSIAEIPDRITREMYIREIARFLSLDESVLFNELQRQLLNKNQIKIRELKRTQVARTSPETQNYTTHSSTVDQEKEIIRLLLLYGHREYEENRTVANEIIDTIGEIEWEDAILHEIFNEYIRYYNEHQQYPDYKYFSHHQKPQIQDFAISVALPKDISVSKEWLKRFGKNIDYESNYRKEVYMALRHLELRKLQQRLETIKKDLKKTGLTEKEIEKLQKTQLLFINEIKEISEELKIVIY